MEIRAFFSKTSWPGVAGQKGGLYSCYHFKKLNHSNKKNPNKANLQNKAQKVKTKKKKGKLGGI